MQGNSWAHHPITSTRNDFLFAESEPVAMWPCLLLLYLHLLQRIFELKGGRELGPSYLHDWFWINYKTEEMLVTFPFVEVKRGWCLPGKWRVEKVGKRRISPESLWFLGLAASEFSHIFKLYMIVHIPYKYSPFSLNYFLWTYNWPEVFQLKYHRLFSAFYRVNVTWYLYWIIWDMKL